MDFWIISAILLLKYSNLSTNKNVMLDENLVAKEKIDLTNPDNVVQFEPAEDISKNNPISSESEIWLLFV